jgi:hypothetical protein
MLPIHHPEFVWDPRDHFRLDFAALTAVFEFLT